MFETSVLPLEWRLLQEPWYSPSLRGGYPQSRPQPTDIIALSIYEGPGAISVQLFGKIALWMPCEDVDSTPPIRAAVMHLSVRSPGYLAIRFDREPARHGSRRSHLENPELYAREDVVKAASQVLHLIRITGNSLRSCVLGLYTEILCMYLEVFERFSYYMARRPTRI